MSVSTVQLDKHIVKLAPTRYFGAWSTNFCYEVLLAQVSKICCVLDSVSQNGFDFNLIIWNLQSQFILCLTNIQLIYLRWGQDMMLSFPSRQDEQNTQEENDALSRLLASTIGPIFGDLVNIVIFTHDLQHSESSFVPVPTSLVFMTVPSARSSLGWTNRWDMQAIFLRLFSSANECSTTGSHVYLDV